MSFKPNDTKREEFRKYLERTGVMDALTKVLVSLYEEPERPTDALDYLRSKLVSTTGESMESMRAQVEELKTRVAELEAENATLKGEAEPPATEEA